MSASHYPVPSFRKKLIVITAPSGAGKTSIVHKLLTFHKNYAFSISATTREKRVGELDGKDYYFLSSSEFQKRVSNREFVEYQEVYPGMFYGTLRSEIERLWEERKVVLFDIDVKGAENLKKEFGNDAFVIFIKPPSKESLINRLKNRNTESADSLNKRIKRAEEELTYES